MKLRNKKTGQVVDTEEDYFYMTFSNNVLPKDGFTSIKHFNEVWEDYEPLIKDKKIRKAVRAWAEAWSKNKLYKHADNVLSTVDNFVIQFGQTAFIDLEEKRAYTITELCGEEEE